MRHIGLHCILAMGTRRDPINSKAKQLRSYPIDRISAGVNKNFGARNTSTSSSIRTFKLSSSSLRAALFRTTWIRRPAPRSQEGDSDLQSCQNYLGIWTSSGVELCNVLRNCTSSLSFRQNWLRQFSCGKLYGTVSNQNLYLERGSRRFWNCQSLED